MLPERFGSPRIIQRRIAQWQSQGLLDSLWFHYLDQLPATERRGWREAFKTTPGRKRAVWYWEMFGKLQAMTEAASTRSPGYESRHLTD